MVRLMTEAMEKLPPIAKAALRVELHPDPCPRCGGKQAVNQAHHIREDLPEAMCVDFDCYIIGRQGP